MRNYLNIILFVCLAKFASSQCIEGTVKGTNGKPVAFATIYATDVSKGTTSNIDGNYKLDLPKGNHSIIVRYLGFKTKELEVNCQNENQKLDIVLEEQLYKIPEVRILASGEDPANFVMRKAIAMSYYYLNQVEEYNSRVYIKGTGKVIKIPRLFKKALKEEGIEVGVPIIVENITDVHFKLPDVLEHNTISIRSTMEMDQVSPIDYLALSLYRDTDGVISPLSKNAFSYYKFQLVSSFYDQDYLVHRIKIIPKREGYDLYKGYISIVEGFWHLYSTELKVEQKMFKMDINQVYTPIENDVWMPVGQDFVFDISIMGAKAIFNYTASASDYKVKLNSRLDHSAYRTMLKDSKQAIQEIKEVEQEQKSSIQELVQKEDLNKKESRKLRKLIKEEVKKSVPERKLEITDENTVEDSASLRSVVYWDSIRPIPLTVEEMESYKIKDSIQLRMETDSTFKDSLERKDSKFKWNKVFTGGTFDYKNGHSFSTGGLIDLSSFNFNTVDGLKLGLKFSYDYQNDKGKEFSIKQKAQYAFARERMMSYMSLSYQYNGLKRASINVNGGRKTSDFDDNTGISENLNLLTTLFLKENYLKLYQKDFAEISHKFDIINGFVLFTGFEYAQRKELSNHSDFYFTNPLDKNFTPNKPVNINQNLVNSHNASILELEANYTPEYYYRINKGTKQMSYSNYPTFSVNYKKGINSLFDSDVDFDRLEAKINHGFSIKRVGYLQYKLTAGSFLNNKKTFFADYKHFGTNTPFIIGSSEGSMLRLPDFYDYSTNKEYFEANFSLSDDRLLLKYLPVLNKTIMTETFYFNYLSVNKHKPYYEIGYGLNQIFLMFNAEIFVGFEGSKHEYTGIKIGIPFVGRNGDSITL